MGFVFSIDMNLTIGGEMVWTISEIWRAQFIGDMDWVIAGWFVDGLGA